MLNHTPALVSEKRSRGWWGGVFTQVFETRFDHQLDYCRTLAGSVSSSLKTPVRASMAAKRH